MAPTRLLVAVLLLAGPLLGQEAQLTIPPRDAQLTIRPPEGPRIRFPDLPVVTQEGEEVSFYEDLVADKVVAITFISTTCRTACPAMAIMFSELQELLGEAAGRDVHLISISADPVTDTPARLEEWGDRFRAGPGWTLLTGGEKEIGLILKALKGPTSHVEDHYALVLYGSDRSGDWIHSYNPPSASRLVERLRTFQTRPES
ncbi:MAG: SCO family protein [Acidobacteria bacterium]|nr:SCO family protein [Acidobacteriota bacterium]